MVRAQTFLSPSSFVYYCCWAGVGIAGMLVPSVLMLWFLAGLFLTGLAIMDRIRLAPADKLTASITLQHRPELHQLLKVKFAVLAAEHISLSLHRVVVLHPKSQLLRFGSARTPLVASGAEYQGESVAHAKRLGYESWQHLEVEYCSPLGLWIRRASVAAPELQYRVSPRIPPPPEDRLRTIIAQQRLLLTGNRQVMRSRSRDQFHSLRAYRYPDSIRDVDQKKSAKYGSLMVRTYESLHQHRIILALDCGRTSLGSIVGSPKFDFLLSAILGLAHDAVRNKDALSFVAFSRSVRYAVPYARSLSALLPLLRGDAALRPQEEETDYEILPRFVAAHGGGRSIVLLFSDLSRPSSQQALLRALQPLCQKHVTVALGISDSTHSVDDMVKEGMELNHENFWNAFYAYHLDESFSRFRSAVGTIGGAALQVPHQYWMGTTARVYQLLRNSLRT